MKEIIEQQKSNVSAIFKEHKQRVSYYKIAKDSGLTTRQLHIIEKCGAYTIDSFFRLLHAFNLTIEIKKNEERNSTRA